MDFAACFKENRILLEGALGERLKREYGLVPDPEVAWAALVYSEEGRSALARLWGEYIGTAKTYGLPFAATTPTRRANRARAERSKYGGGIIADNAAFLKSIRDASGTEMYAGGLMGCKGDAYRGTDVLSTEEAYAFHSWQAELFAEAGADFLYAGIMPALPEIKGMARALEATGLPYIISFMIRENGRLIDGKPIHMAIAETDGAVLRKPLCYMTNCVHPKVLYSALSVDFNRTELVKERFCGIQANTASLSPEELDGSEELVCSGSAELAEDIFRLKELIPLRIVGGCCGTDNTHMAEIAKRWSVAG